VKLEFLQPYFDERGKIMTLVNDTWSANLSPAPKTFKIAKVLSSEVITSGAAVTVTANFFVKDCPFDVEVVGVMAIMRAITVADFDGANAALGVIIHNSDEVDASPTTPPTTVVWDTLVASVDCKAIAADALCFDAPGDSTNVLDQTHIDIPKGGSMRAQMSAQADDDEAAYADKVEILVIAEFRPTNLKERRYF